MELKNGAKLLRDKAGRFKGKTKEKLKGLIPSRHVAKWKLIAEGSLAVIVIVGLFEITHYIFQVHFSEDFLIALEIIDYLAIFILAIDLLHHYLKNSDKPKFLKDKLLYILSFLPYLIFYKAAGVLLLIRPLKPIFTGVAKIIKVFSHKEEIKNRVEDVTEKVGKATKTKTKIKRKKKNK